MQITKNTYYTPQTISQYKMSKSIPSFQSGRELEQTGNTNKQKFNFFALTGAVIGTLIPALIILRPGKDKSKLLKKILNTDFASAKNLLPLAGGSILGGLGAGILSDKGEGTWNKVKEANFQMISNVISPFIMLKLFKAGSSKLTKNSNKFVKWAASTTSMVAGVVTGVMTGAIISNKVNNDLIKKGDPYHRNVKLTDFFIHVDDIPLALGIAKVGQFDKILPFVVLTCGYHAGKQK